MRLIVGREYNKEMVDDECHLATNMLAMKATHLFIASYHWDSIQLAIEDVIPIGYLRCLPLVSKDIKVSLPERITDHTMTLLTEVYPEKAGSIRRAYMTGQPLKGVLEECLVQ